MPTFLYYYTECDLINFLFLRVIFVKYQKSVRKTQCLSYEYVLPVHIRNALFAVNVQNYHPSYQTVTKYNNQCDTYAALCISCYKLQ